MNSNRDKLRSSLRIVWAIAAKDIVDAIRNRTTISVILGVAIMMLTSQALPLLLGLSDVHRMAVYDAGESCLAAELEDSEQFSSRPVASREELKVVLGEASDVLLGLVIPANFDQTLETDGEV